MPTAIENREIDGSISRQISQIRRAIGETNLRRIMREVSTHRTSLSEDQSEALISGDIRIIQQHAIAALHQATLLADRITPAANEEMRRQMIDFMTQANQLIIQAGLTKVT